MPQNTRKSYYRGVNGKSFYGNKRYIWSKSSMSVQTLGIPGVYINSSLILIN